MDDTGELRFLAAYEEYARTSLIPTRGEIRSLFERWREPGFWAKYAPRSRLPAPSPFQRAFTHIKRPESVVDKILRKPPDFPDGLSPNSFRKMYDAVRGRCVVYFLSHFPLIDREIRESQDIEISTDFPPVAYLSSDLTGRFGLSHLQRKERESGYASVHYILRFRDSVVPREDRPWFELQVRTLVEDAWGEIEHILGYKPNKRTSFAVRKQFQILSKELSAIDEHFNFLYEELLRFQEEVNYRDSDPLNAENIASVLDEVGLSCAQQEIDGLLKVLFSHGIGNVHDFRAIAIPSHIDAIRGTHMSELGRPPKGFEVVANLAAAKGAKSIEELVERVRAQIKFLEAWLHLKREMG